MPREIVDALQHLLADARQDAAALGGRRLAPVAVERRLRRGDGGVDVGGRAARDCADGRAVEGFSIGR